MPDMFALNQLSRLGFTVSPVIKSPFDAVTHDTSTRMLTCFGDEDSKIIQKAIVASELSKVMDRFSIMIVERKKEHDSIDDTVVMSNEELKKIDAPKELTDLVASRRTKK